MATFLPVYRGLLLLLLLVSHLTKLSNVHKVTRKPVGIQVSSVCYITVLHYITIIILCFVIIMSHYITTFKLHYHDCI